MADVDWTRVATRESEASDAKRVAPSDAQKGVPGAWLGEIPRGTSRRIVLQGRTLGGDGIDAGHEHGVGVVARRRRGASQRPIDRVGEDTFVGVVAVAVGAVVVATGRC